MASHVHPAPARAYPARTRTTPARSRPIPAKVRVHPARARSAQSAIWHVLDNWKLTLASRPAWADHGMSIVGGLMYVTLPTAIEAIFRVDLTGWKGYITTFATNMLIGGACKSPGYMAGALGAAAAHLVYAKLQEPIFLRTFRKYAFRFDPSVVTSSMSDRQPVAVPSGTTLRTVAGETIAAFPPSPAAASVGLAPTGTYQTPVRAMLTPMQTAVAGQPPTGAAMQDSYSTTLKDSYTTTLKDSYTQDLADGYTRHLHDGYTRNLDDGYSRNLDDGYGRDLAPSKRNPGSSLADKHRTAKRAGYNRPFNSGWK